MTDKELKNVFHIAGTNGKGSCLEILTNILICAGYKVGKFLSPHLIKYNERISINNNYISSIRCILHFSNLFNNGSIWWYKKY